MKPRGRRRWLVLTVALALALIAALAFGGFSWLVMVYPETPGPGSGRIVELTVGPKDGLGEIARQLGASGAVRRPSLFALYARVRGAGPRLRRGLVLVHDGMTPLSILQRIARGYGAAEMRVVIPEGYTRFDIARRFARFGLCSEREFLDASADPALLERLDLAGLPSAEGYLFPDTYRLHDAMGAPALVERLARNGRRRMDELFARHQAALATLSSELGFGVREVVTLASIVEKEAAVAAEQPVIAGVFLNRLRDPTFTPKRLQADPTLAYGCLIRPELASCAGFDGRRITRAMLVDIDNPYNTYRHGGLPPGPIANPGLSALEAVLAPAQHDYFYFVARGDGRHRFSATLEGHNDAVRALR